ncbi:MAG: hypothetical protein Q8M53_00105, partial [Burkholderiales bacterium]|nr:hypothetical protein [Burkholderiales bacterium]
AVTNNGLITSPNGEVVLAAGNSVELVNPGTPNLRVEITAPDNEARNLGTISAEAGRIGIYAGLIHNSGALNASSAVVDGGRILLKATQNIETTAASTISASGSTGGAVTLQSGDTTLVEGQIAATGSSGTGGTIQVLGNRVGLVGNASIDASGNTGGGTVLVGGDFQGANPEVQNAQRTFVGSDVTIKANAINNGDGGKVIVWADDATRFYGNIAAQGGAVGGNGGFAEVSGKNYLDYRGLANLSAPQGNAGNLLLDPGNIIINDTGPDSFAFYGGFIGGGLFEAGDGTSTLTWTTILNNLVNNDVAITTIGFSGLSGDIDVQQGKTFTSSNSLGLFAHRNINVGSGAHIVNEGTGDINMFAGWNEASGTISCCVAVNSGQGDLTVNANIITQGMIFLQAGKDVNINNALISSGGPNAGYAHVGVNAYGGNVNINNSTVRARGGNSSVADGYWGELSIWADAGTVTVQNNSVLDAIGGNTSAAGYRGGFGNISNSANALNYSGSQVIATGGSGEQAGDAYIDSVSVGHQQITNSTFTAAAGTSADGYSGGSGYIYLESESLGISGSQLTALAANNGTRGWAEIEIDLWGNATIENSTLTANGQSAWMYLYANGSAPAINLTNSALNVTAADGGEGYIEVRTVGAGSTINAGSSTITVQGVTVEGGEGYYYSPSARLFADGNIALGQVSAQEVYVQSSSGAIIDGNIGLNIAANYMELRAATGIGSFDNPLETQAAYLFAQSSSGEIGVINAGDLNVYRAYNWSGSVTVGATGNLTVMADADGAEGGGGLALGANGNLNIFNPIYSSGPMTLQAGGELTIGGPSSGSFVDVYSGDTLTMVAGTNLNVLPSSYGSSSSVRAEGIATVITGGNVLVDQSTLYGSPDVFMQVGGLININGTLVHLGRIEADSANTINVNFTSSTGGFSVNGVAGLVYDPVTQTGFWVDGGPASLGNGLNVIYTGTPPVSTLTIPTENLIVAMGESSKPPDPEKDKDVFNDVEEKKKKDAPVCR